MDHPAPLSPAQRIMEDRDQRSIPKTPDTVPLHRTTREALSPVGFSLLSTPPAETVSEGVGMMTPVLDAHMAQLEREITELRTKGEIERKLPRLHDDGSHRSQNIPEDDRRGVGRPDLAATFRLGLPALCDEELRSPVAYEKLKATDGDDNDDWMQGLDEKPSRSHSQAIQRQQVMPGATRIRRKGTQTKLAPLKNATTAVFDEHEGGEAGTVGPVPPPGNSRAGGRGRGMQRARRASQGSLPDPSSLPSGEMANVAPLAPLVAQPSSLEMLDRTSLERTTHPIVRGDAALRNSRHRRLQPLSGRVSSHDKRSESLPATGGLAALPLPPVLPNEHEAQRLCAEGVKYQKEDQLEHAARMFDQALSSSSGHVETLVRYGLLLLGQGKTVQAETLLNKAALQTNCSEDQKDLAARAYQVLERQQAEGSMQPENDLMYAMEY